MLSLDDIRGLKRREILTCFVMFFSIIAPGVLLLCLWDMPLVLAVTTPKLVLLASAITLPLASFNTAIIGITSLKEDQDDLHLHFLFGCFVSSFPFYTALVLKFFLPLSGALFVQLLLLLNLVFLLFAIGSNRRESKTAAKDGDSKDAGERADLQKS